MSGQAQATMEEHIKRQYINRFKQLMKGQPQAENEEMLTGEKYILKSHLAQAKEQTLEMETRVGIVAKFSIITNKLAFDGVVCEEVAK
jgi:hypothetical protein